MGGCHDSYMFRGPEVRSCGDMRMLRMIASTPGIGYTLAAYEVVVPSNTDISKTNEIWYHHDREVLHGTDEVLAKIGVETDALLRRRSAITLEGKRVGPLGVGGLLEIGFRRGRIMLDVVFLEVNDSCLYSFRDTGFSSERREKELLEEFQECSFDQAYEQIARMNLLRVDGALHVRNDG